MIALLLLTAVSQHVGKIGSSTIDRYDFIHYGSRCKLSIKSVVMPMVEKPYVSASMLIEGISISDTFGKDVAFNVLSSLTIEYKGFKGSYSNLIEGGFVPASDSMKDEVLTGKENSLYVGISLSKNKKTMCLAFSAADGGASSTYAFILTKNKAVIFDYHTYDESTRPQALSVKCLADYLKYGSKYHYKKSK